MSKLFYDHLVNFDKIEKRLKTKVSDFEERQEIWKIIDDIIHNSVLTSIFDKLPKEYHRELLVMIDKNPHDKGHLVFISEKSSVDINDHIRREIDKLELKLLKSFI